MDKETLIEKLKNLSKMRDIESAHLEADELLLTYIGDEDVRAAFDKLIKWYA